MDQLNNNSRERNTDEEVQNVFQKDLQFFEAGRFRCSTDYRNRLAEPREQFSKSTVFIISLTVFLILFFSVYCIISKAFNLKEGFYSPETKTTVILGLNGRPGTEKLTDENGKFTPAGICETVSPSVVQIVCFGETDNPVSSGSGIILSKDGYIVTNAHVINTGKNPKVSLSDQTILNAQIIGYDSKTDIGIIKINPGSNTLTPAAFGNSDEVVQGEQVMAIGNPGGLHGSISGGYVSGINRMIRADQTGYEMNCIQTDAAISPGNSGGALVNMYGQVIGITSSKYVNSSYEGLGFAITINDAKPVIEELIANGYIGGRIKIGISFYEITEEHSRETGLPQGLFIYSMDESCDISESGLKEHDIIVEVEGDKVFDYDSFMNAIRSHGKGAGDKVHAKAIRADENDVSKQTEIEIEFTPVEDTSGDY